MSNGCPENSRFQLSNATTNRQQTLAIHPHLERKSEGAIPVFIPVCAFSGVVVFRDCLLESYLERLERVKGIEPSFQAWEAHVLPLNHTRRQLTGFS